MELLVGGRFRVRRTLIAMALVSAVGAGCSGSKADDSAAPEEPAAAAGEASDGADGGGSTTTTAPPKKGSASKQNSGNTTTTAEPGGSVAANADGSAAEEEDPYKKTLAITAELAESCVRPGGTQTVTIRTLPYAGVGYDTEYSDYLTGMMEGHYGGNAGGFTDDDGTYTSTWAITPNAPAGKATVKVLGSHHDGGIGEARAYYTVADALGKCE